MDPVDIMLEIAAITGEKKKAMVILPLSQEELLPCCSHDEHDLACHVRAIAKVWGYYPHLTSDGGQVSTTTVHCRRHLDILVSGITH